MIFYLLLITPLVTSIVVVTLDSQRTIGWSERDVNPVTRLKFCSDCDDPSSALPYLYALSARFGPRTFRVTGELVYGVPNFGEGKKLLNYMHTSNRVVLLARGGGIPIVDKVRKAQAAGAIAVVIIDDGQCDHELSSCGPRAGGRHDGGFSSSDSINDWSTIKIPAVLITSDSADALRKNMQLERTEIGKLGMHNISVLARAQELSAYQV